METRERIARFIIEQEARRDERGRVKVYTLPLGDGGGRFEVFGINDKYHPHEAAELARLVRAGRQAEAEERAAEYIAGYTDVVSGWTKNPGLELALRDAVFNRGARGAARILQRALRMQGRALDEDGRVGPITKKLVAGADAMQLIAALRVARESYERDPVGRDEKSEFWKGLVARWDRVTMTARKLASEKRVG